MRYDYAKLMETQGEEYREGIEYEMTKRPGVSRRMSSIEKELFQPEVIQYDLMCRDCTY